MSWVRMWKKGNPYHCGWKCKLVASIEVPQKIKDRTIT